MIGTCGAVAIAAGAAAVVLRTRERRAPVLDLRTDRTPDLNVLLIVTDQERAWDLLPAGFIERYCPARVRLLRESLHFSLDSLGHLGMCEVRPTPNVEDGMATRGLARGGTLEQPVKAAVVTTAAASQVVVTGARRAGICLLRQPALSSRRGWALMRK